MNSLLGQYGIIEKNTRIIADYYLTLLLYSIIDVLYCAVRYHRVSAHKFEDCGLQYDRIQYTVQQFHPHLIFKPQSQ